MNTANRVILPLLAMRSIGLLPAQQPAEAAAIKSDGAVQIDGAIAKAKAKNKRALVAFLSDDPLSPQLDDALRKDRTLARQLLYEFVVARADAEVDAKLATARGADLAELGTPALLVLDGEGCLLAKLNKHAFWSEQNGLEPKTLNGLLQKFHAPPLDAEEVLSAALATAKQQDKRLLLHFDAPW